MKKKFLLKTAVVAIGVMMCGSAWAESTVPTGAFKVVFENQQMPTGWTSVKASAPSGGAVLDDGSFEVNAAGHLAVTMTKLSKKDESTTFGSYRRDLKYENSDGVDVNTTNDKILAIKFIGQKPSGSFKMEVQINDGSNDNYIYKNGSSLSDPGATTVTTNNNDYIYCIDLSAFSNTSKSIAWSNVQKIKKISLVFADNTSTETDANKYTIDWIATFASTTDVESYKNWADDGNADTDEGNVVNTSTELTYTTLKAAVEAVAANDNTIQMNGNTTETGRIDLPNYSGLTVNGNSKSVVRGYDGATTMMLISKSGYTNSVATFNNVVFDGGNYKATTQAFEINKTVTFNNVTFTKFNISGSSIVKPIAGSTTIMQGTITLSDNADGTSVFYLNKNAYIYENNVTYQNASNATVVPSFNLHSTFVNNGVVAKIYNESSSEAISPSKYTIVNDGWVTRNASTGSDKLSLRAILEPTRTTAVGNYGTICLPYDATSEGVILMRCAGIKSDNSAIVFNYVGSDGETESETPVENATVKAGVPYLYRATGDVKFTCTGTTYTAATPENNFVGVYTDGKLDAGSYFLYSKNDNTGVGDDKIHKAGSDIKFTAYKCYFTALPTATAAKAGISFSFFGAPTAINGVEATDNAKVADGKFIQNGKLVIVKNGKQFNAAGQRME